MSSYSFLFKFIIIGDSSVGKSCMLVQFLEKKFKSDHDATIGVQFGAKIVQVQNKNLKLQIWDTAGQETFKSITRTYYRGSIGAVLVYDITNKDSFDSLNKWIEETKSYANDKLSLMLVGNKLDLEAKRAVPRAAGEEFAKLHNMLFAETSAKTGNGIEQLFSQLSTHILERIGRKQLDVMNESIGIKIGNEFKDKEEPKKAKKCC